MAKMFQVYGIGQALISVLPPPVPFENAPTSNQTNYEIGQLVYTPPKTPTAFYLYAGGGIWVQFASNSGDIIAVQGTANQVAVSTVAGVATVSLIGPYTPSTYTAHGVLIGEGTSSIVATSAGTAGQVLVSGGASANPTWTTATFPTTAGAAGTILRSDGTNYVSSTDTWPNTVVAGDILIATGTNVIGSLADVAVGQLLASGGVGVVPAYTASPSVTGNMTAATGFVATTAGAGITLNSAATAGTTTATLNGRSGQVTITTPTINAGSTFTMTIANTSITGSTTQVLYGLTGGTTGSAITIQSVTNSANQSAVVVQNASAVTNSTGSLVLTFLVLN
jgi:hypothetical protein